MTRTIVVVGGALGGPLAAARAREYDEDARIVLVEKRRTMAWVQAGLRHQLEGKADHVAAVDEERARSAAARHRIEVRTGVEAVRLDVDARRLVLKTDAGTEALRFDAAVYSGGAEFRRPDVALLDGPGVTTFRTRDDLAQLRAARAAGASRALVVGGGIWGVDAAQGLLAAGFTVDLVERNDRILPKFSRLAAKAAEQELRARGVRVRLSSSIAAVEAQDGARRQVRLTDGALLDVEHVVIATRFRPVARLLEEAGASLNGDGSVRVDATMATTLPGVFACGHAVAVPHAVTRKPVWLPHAATATRTAQIAGRNAAARDGERLERMSAVAGTTLVKIGDVHFARTGLTDQEATAFFGAERLQTMTVQGYTAEPWAGGDPICVRMIVARAAGEGPRGDPQRAVVVGGEAWGRTAVPRRIDLLAAAVLEGWSPWRVADLDIAYEASLGPAPDPVNLAGALAALSVAGDARPIDALALRAALATADAPVVVDVGRAGDAPGPWPDGTRRIPLEELRDRLGEIPRDRPVVVVSTTGQRAYAAFRVLAQRGFAQARFLDGGARTFALAMPGV